MTMSPRALLEAIDFKVSQLWKWDLVLGLAGGAGGAWLAINYPQRLDTVVFAALGLVGVIIGAVIAGAAILGVFLDQEFLRKLKTINSEPVHFFSPFLFTVVVGVAAILFLLVLQSLSPNVEPWVRSTLSGFAGLTTIWAVTSVIYDLDALVQFLRLQQAAAERSDESGAEGDSVRRLPSGK
jgi:MFS family permease